VYGKQYITTVALEVAFYRTPAGSEPVREWLLNMTKAIRGTIGSDIGMVQDKWPVGKPLVDGFGTGLWEVRSTHDKIEYRVLFGIVGGTMYLLHGVVKKSTTTPVADVRLARERLAEVLAKEKSTKKT
jgi:phage-related protein